MEVVILWYNKLMYNWSVDTKELEKNREKFTLWKLEQLINFGLNGEKINEEELRKYWKALKIDPDRRRFLKLLIDGI